MHAINGSNGVERLFRANKEGAVDFKHFFMSTSKKSTEKPVALSKEAHLEAFHACQTLLSQRDIDPSTRDQLSAAVPYIVNHPDFAVDEQRAALPLIQEYSHDLVRSYYDCATIEHATYDFCLFAIEALIFFAEDGGAEERKEAITKLSEIPLYPAIDRRLCSRAIAALRKIVIDQEENDDIRMSAAKELCLWLWTEKEAMRETIDPLLHLFQTTPALQATIGKWLFYRLGVAKEEDPVLQYLFPIFTTLIHSPLMSLEARCILAEQMPKGSRHILLQEKPAIALFFLMQNLLGQPEHPKELKKIYVPHLISYYFHPTTVRLIAPKTPEELIKFLADEELRACGTAALAQLRKEQAEYARDLGRPGRICLSAL